MILPHPSKNPAELLEHLEGQGPPWNLPVTQTFAHVKAEAALLAQWEAQLLKFTGMDSTPNTQQSLSHLRNEHSKILGDSHI